MSRRLSASLLVALLAVAPAPARADIPLPLIEELIGPQLGPAITGELSHTRRAIAIGPEVGGAYVVGDGVSTGAVSIGLALYTFKRPSLKERLIRRIQDRARARLEELIAAGGPPPDTRQVIEDEGRAVLGALEAELAALREVQRRTLERPSLKVVGEGVILTDGGWQARVGVSKGVRALSVGLGGGVQRAGGDTAGVAGVELSLHLTPWGLLRTPVVDVFGRVDAVFADPGAELVGVVGLRLALDVL